MSADGESGVIEEIDKDGKVLWSFSYKSQNYVMYHDIEPMPNGNVLAIVKERKTVAEAIALGFPSDTREDKCPEKIIEIAPPDDTLPARIVWQWCAWDHFVKENQSGNHPELFSIGLGSSGKGRSGDFMHMNSISYNDSLDLITFGCHYLNEIYVIDHSATTIEAVSHSGGKRGKGGDILYRWGSPSNYSVNGEPYFDVVHCAVWIPYGLPGGGHIMAINNRIGSRRKGSVFIELELSIDSSGNFVKQSGVFGPSKPYWTYNDPNYHSSGQGSIQRLPNGNTIMAENGGLIREVTNSGNIVWEYESGGGLAQIQKYSEDFRGVKILMGLTEGISCTQRAKGKELTILQKKGEIFLLDMIGTKVSLYRVDGKELIEIMVTKTFQPLIIKGLSKGTYILNARRKSIYDCKIINYMN